MRHTIEKIKEIVSRYGYGPSSIFMTEWNASPSHRDLCHDTLYMASFIARNICGNMDSIASFGFWTASDLIEEFPLPAATFHGGMGLMTTNGVRKAGYYAFWLLSRMGDAKIAAGPGYLITSDERGYQLLLYHYCHFDPLYCSMDHSGITPVSRYNVFKDSFNKTVQISLTGLKACRYEIREYVISRSHGSAFDAWVEMGAPENPDADEIVYLNQKSAPLYQRKMEVIQDAFMVQRCLTPHEVRLIMIQENMD